MDKSPKSLAIAYDMARRSKVVANKAHPAPSPLPRTAEEPRPQSIAEAILAKRRAPAPALDDEAAEPEAADTGEDFDLDAFAAEEEAPKGRVDSIRAKLKALRGF